MLAGIDYTGISVGFLCHDGQGNFLFHKRSQQTRDEHGAWDWGGGKLEFGETIVQGLAREIKEEYGCDIISIDEVLPPTDWSATVAGQQTHWVILTHIVRVDRNQVKNNEPQSIAEIGWFILDNLPQPLHQGVAREVTLFKEIIQQYTK